MTSPNIGLMTDQPPPPPPYTPNDPHTPSSETSRTSIVASSPYRTSLRGGYIDVIDESDDHHFLSAAAYFEERPWDLPVPSLTITVDHTITPGTTRDDLTLPGQDHEWQTRDIYPQDWATFVNYVVAAVGTHSDPGKGKADSISQEEFQERQRRLEAVIAEWNELFFGPRGVRFVPTFNFIVTTRPSSPTPSYRTSQTMPPLPHHFLPAPTLQSPGASTLKGPETGLGDPNSFAVPPNSQSPHLMKNMPLQGSPQSHRPRRSWGPLAFLRDSYQDRRFHGNDSHEQVRGYRRGVMGRGNRGRERNQGHHSRRGDYHTRSSSTSSSASSLSDVSDGSHHHKRSHRHKWGKGRRRRSSSSSSSSSSSDSSDDSHRRHKRGHRHGKEKGHHRRSHSTSSSSSSSSESSISSISSDELKNIDVADIHQSLANFRLDPTRRQHVKLAVRQLHSDLRSHQKGSEAERRTLTREMKAELKTQKRLIKTEVKSLKKEAKAFHKERKQQRRREHRLQKKEKHRRKAESEVGVQRSGPYSETMLHSYPQGPSMLGLGSTGTLSTAGVSRGVIDEGARIADRFQNRETWPIDMKSPSGEYPDEKATHNPVFHSPQGVSTNNGHNFGNVPGPSDTREAYARQPTKDVERRQKEAERQARHRQKESERAALRREEEAGNEARHLEERARRFEKEAERRRKEEDTLAKQRAEELERVTEQRRRDAGRVTEQRSKSEAQRQLQREQAPSDRQMRLEKNATYRSGPGGERVDPSRLAQTQANMPGQWTDHSPLLVDIGGGAGSSTSDVWTNGARARDGITTSVVEGATMDRGQDYGTYFETLGRSMEKWGERFGRDMGDWGERLGRNVEARFS
ncbi:hypothetical protein MMC19_006420 [Ptychographa xylographoides]|nr:hypothetical protein [Ptychographa xylographoides]